MVQLSLTYNHHLTHIKKREETEFLEELLHCFEGFTEFSFTGWGVRDKQLRTAGLLGVKKLCLKGCWRLTDDGIANLCTAGYISMQGWTSQLMELDISHCVGLTDATGVILRSYATSLTALNISNTAIGDEGIRNVLEAATNLKHLRAQSCHGLTDQGLLHILTSIKRYKSLQLLDISECQRCTDNGVMALLSGSSYLKELFLANSIHLSTCSLLGLDRAPFMTTSLHQLNLQSMKFHDNAMEWITAGCKHLTTLNISTCTSLTDHALQTLGHACLPLQDLDISNCTEFTDAGLGKFLTLCGKTLKRLVIDGCFQAADETMSATGTCQELCILSARDITRPTDSALKDLAAGRGCKCLSEVNFSTQLDGIDLTNWRHSPQFGAIGIRAIVAASSKQLVSLQIDGVFKVDDRVLRQLGTTCPALKTFSLKEVSRVTDMGMGVLARGCQLLSHLVLSGCHQLTDKSVIYVARPLLVHLNIGGCKKITDTALLALASRSPSLAWLSVRDCEWIGDRGFTPLLKSCRKLTYLDARGLVDLTIDTLDWLPPTLMRGNFRSCPQINGDAVSMTARKLPLVQVMAGQPFCIEPASLACRMYNSYCIEKDRKDRAALIIQICYRGMKRFRNLQKRQRTNLKMRRAIHCLQLFLNKICTRHSIEMLLENALHHQHLIRSTTAAVQVQRMWRGFCGRQSRDAMVTHRDLATAWYCLSEGLKLERRDRAKSRAVSIIQQAVRMWLYELEASRLREAKWKSSRIIQSAWQRHSARMKAIKIAKQKVGPFSFYKS